MASYMNDVVVFKPIKKSKIFALRPEFERTGETDVFYIRDNLRSLKKIIKYSGGRKIVPDINMSNMKITRQYIKKYSAINTKTLLPVINTVVRSVIKKIGMPFPLSEIYIDAQPQSAIEIIEKIRGCAKLFTVISPCENTGKLYDELYFKYGTIIRQIPAFCYNEKDEVLVIKANTEDSVPTWVNYPVINLSREMQNKDKFFNAGKFCIYDGQADFFTNIWGGKPTVELYSFLKMLPRENADVDINNAGEDIFLLDTAQL